MTVVQHQPPLDSSLRQQIGTWLTQARQGEPEAIAHLLNHQFKSEGILVRTSWKDNCLGILLEGDPLPSLAEFIPQVQAKIREIAPKSVHAIKVYGRCHGHYHPSWYDEFSLEPIPNETVNLGLMDWLSQGMQHMPAADDGSATDRSATPALSLTSGVLPDRSPLVALKKAMGVTQSDRDGLLEGDRFLRVCLDSTLTALLPLTAITEILKVPISAVIPVPHMPASILGIYNCRGTMLWLVDLALQLGLRSVLTETPLNRDSILTIMALQSNNTTIGAIVPQVHDIETYSTEALRPATPDLFPPQLLAAIQGYLAHVSTAILNVDALLHHSAFQTHRAAL